MPVPSLALLVGVILTAAGAFAYLNGTPDPATGAVSPTALIPAAVGGLLAVCGLVAYAAPAARKHAMHAAAMVGLLGFLGGFMPLVRGYSKTGTVDFGKPAVQAGVLMIGLCLLFVIACVKSFRDARKARTAAG
ncbi:MAG: hypothetical protein U0871_21250 [Gemmataceae bacterium]